MTTEELSALLVKLKANPELSPDQTRALMSGFGAILPPTEIYRVGWQQAIGAVQLALALDQIEETAK